MARSDMRAASSTGMHINPTGLSGPPLPPAPSQQQAGVTAASQEHSACRASAALAARQVLAQLLGCVATAAVPQQQVAVSSVTHTTSTAAVWALLVLAQLLARQQG